MRRATRDIADLYVHRRASCSVRGRSDLPGAHRARMCDRPRTFYAWLNREPSKRALWDMTITEVLAGYYEPDEHGRRAPEASTGPPKMWAHLHREGYRGGPMHRGAADAGQWRQGWHGRSPHHRTWIQGPPGSAPGGPPVHGSGSQRARCRRFHRTAVNRAFVYRVPPSMFAGRIVGWQWRQQTHPCSWVRDPPSRELAGWMTVNH